jgi:RNA recognition motif-containing protein
LKTRTSGTVQEQRGIYKTIMSTKLYVGNFSFDTTENQLRELFEACGPVTEVALIMDRMTNRPRGFGFVTMGTPEGAQAAIKELSGKMVGGRPLTVNEARAREEGGGSRGGGGYSRR